MNAKIICQNFTKEKINEAFTLGKYKKSDSDVHAINYKMYGSGKKILIEFEKPFDFCHLVFLMVDLLEVSRNMERDVQGFVNTSKTNMVTENLNGERVCFYLTEELKQGLKKNEAIYLDIVNIVTSSNKNFTIDIDTLFSYISANRKKFEEPESKSIDYKLIEEGEYLYEKGDFENQYLEALKK